jgi:hypothetical protein
MGVVNSPNSSPGPKMGVVNSPNSSPGPKMSTICNSAEILETHLYI